MTDLRKAAETALEALAWEEIADAKEHLHQALAQPAQRTWVGFTNGEKQYLRALGYAGIDDIEERLKRMNT
jgi:hypothetical protein